MADTITKSKEQPKESIPKKFNFVKVGASVVVIVIIAIVAAFFLTNNTKTIVQHAPPNTNKTVPAAFSNLTLSTGTQTTAAIASFVQSHTSNTSNLEVYYLGSLYVKPSGAGSVASVSTPLIVNYLKQADNISLYVNATSLPIIGSGSMSLLNLSDNTVVCSNLNLTALSHQNYLSTLKTSKQSSCNSTILQGTNMHNLAYSGVGFLENYGFVLNYTTSYQSEFNELNCTYVAGSLSRSSGGNGQFSTCISDTYYVPLTVYVMFQNTQGTVYLSLNETSISNYPATQ
jgi:hypothetical protein